MSFRNIIVNRWPIAVIDLIGHCVLAYALPGKWWFQFLPDIMLPFIFACSWFYNAKLAEDDPVLVVHKLFHTIWPVVSYMLCFWFSSNDKIYIAIALQWGSHVIWDQATHLDSNFKKGLLWIK